MFEVGSETVKLWQSQSRLWGLRLWSAFRSRRERRGFEKSSTSARSPIDMDDTSLDVDAAQHHCGETRSAKTPSGRGILKAFLGGRLFNEVSFASSSFSRPNKTPLRPGSSSILSLSLKLRIFSYKMNRSMVASLLAAARLPIRNSAFYFKDLGMLKANVITIISRTFYGQCLSFW